MNDAQFRAEVRGWRTTELVGRVRLPGQGRHRPCARVRRRAHGLGTAPRRGRLDRPRLARGRRRARPAVAQAGHLLRGVRAGERPGARRPHRRAAGRADAADVRDAGAEGALPAGDRGRDRAVVPGLLGTGGRIRPRLLAHACVRDDEWHIDGRRSDQPGSVADCALLARTEAGPTATGACPACWFRCASRASRSGRSRRSPAPPSSTRCSSTRAAPPRATWRVSRATAGASPRMLGVERGGSTSAS